MVPRVKGNTWHIYGDSDHAGEAAAGGTSKSLSLYQVKVCASLQRAGGHRACACRRLACAWFRWPPALVEAALPAA